MRFRLDVTIGITPELEQLLSRVCGGNGGECDRSGFDYTIGPITEQPTGATAMKSLILKDSQQAILTVGTPISKKGNPATIDGEISVHSEDESVVKVELTGAANTWRIWAVGGVDESTNVIISADALEGEEVEEIQEIIMVGVTAGKAASFQASLSTPEEQPEAPPEEPPVEPLAGRR